MDVSLHFCTFDNPNFIDDSVRVAPCADNNANRNHMLGLQRARTIGSGPHAVSSPIPLPPPLRLFELPPPTKKEDKPCYREIMCVVTAWHQQVCGETPDRLPRDL